MAPPAATLTSLLAVLTLLISSASAQVTQCAPDGSPQLRFVAQLSVSGCALAVHDTGANHTKHLVVEPLMCVTGDLHSVLPRYDPITQQMYVSVPVMLRDDAMLAEVERQLRHLSPESVKFATVTDIRVSTDASSLIQALGFYWTQEDAIGVLRIGCRSDSSKPFCALQLKPFSDPAALALALNQVQLLAALILSSTAATELSFTPMMQHRSLFDVEDAYLRTVCMPTCKQLRFIRSIRLINCTARVHQRLDMKGHFLIEPLLCHNITSMSNESVLYDYSTDTHFLKLDVVLQDDVTVDAVRTQLADLEPRSVAFMRLWRAQSVVASALSGRFRIGPLMVSADWRSAQVRVHCGTQVVCEILRREVRIEPVNLWRHIHWRLTSQISNSCQVVSNEPVLPVKQRDAADKDFAVLLDRPTIASHRLFTGSPDGRIFTLIQQRMTSRVSFQRNWTDYERGFGDELDFWAGLSTIHSLSINGATLRVEMKLWNGTELHAEYAGFKVRNASTNYTMTYNMMLWDRSSVSIDAMNNQNGYQFATVDRNSRRNSLCPERYGNSGWWFDGCYGVKANPNGILADRKTYGDKHVFWEGEGSKMLLPREFRLMLQL